MSRLNLAPTKSNQLNLRQDLDMATEGFTLLEQKREILVMELMHLLNRIKEVQDHLRERQAKAYATLRRAIAQNGYHRLMKIASGIRYEHEISHETRIVAGVRTPGIKVSGEKFHPQFAFADTDSLVDQTMQDFLELLETAGQLAELETTVWLLSRELKKTQRRVNALEHLFIPDYRETLHYITESLEGKELDSFFVMKMVKKKLNEEVVSSPSGDDGASSAPIPG